LVYESVTIREWIHNKRHIRLPAAAGSVLATSPGVCGGALPGLSPAGGEGMTEINGADTAWMLASSALV